jgi:hypothetical protein
MFCIAWSTAIIEIFYIVKLALYLDFVIFWIMWRTSKRWLWKTSTHTVIVCSTWIRWIRKNVVAQRYVQLVTCLCGALILIGEGLLFHKFCGMIVLLTAKHVRNLLCVVGALIIPLFSMFVIDCLELAVFNASCWGLDIEIFVASLTDHPEAIIQMLLYISEVSWHMVFVLTKCRFRHLRLLYICNMVDPDTDLGKKAHHEHTDVEGCPGRSLFKQY